MSLYDHIHESRHLLKLCGDISIKPDIKPKKIKKAIKSYAPGNIESDQVLILIDNTVFGSGKQGMMLTEDMLFAFSNISGKYSIKVKDLESVSPQLRKALGVVPQIGLVLNGSYFVSLPGMVEAVEGGRRRICRLGAQRHQGSGWARRRQRRSRCPGFRRRRARRPRRLSVRGLHHNGRPKTPG